MIAARLFTPRSLHSFGSNNKFMISKPIISVSGLRAVVGDSLTQELIEQYISAYAFQLNQNAAEGPVVLSRDGREFGETICQWVQQTLTRYGRDVLYADILATPTVGVQILEHQAAGAVQVTASHNPPQYNGLKLYGADGRILNAKKGSLLLQHFHQQDTPAESKPGSVKKLTDTNSIHLAKLLALTDISRIQRSQFRVLLDSNHGAGSVLGLPLLKALGCDVVALGQEPDGKFAHPAEPTAQNLMDVCKQVVAHQCDIGLCQDPDADRLALIDARGNYLGEEYTLALCMKQLLSEEPCDVVINCATSRMAYDLADEAGQRCYESAVGEANVVDMMLARKAGFGGEGNGGPIDPRVGLIRDSFVGMVRVLALMARENQPIENIAKGIPAYAIYKDKAPLDGTDASSVFAKLTKQFPDASADQTDGLKLRWANGDWLLVRASNTEPIIRAIAETKSLSDSKELCRKALRT